MTTFGPVERLYREPTWGRFVLALMSVVDTIDPTHLVRVSEPVASPELREQLLEDDEVGRSPITGARR